MTAEEVQIRTKREATERANERMRQEVLPAAVSAYTDGSPAAAKIAARLAAQWNPYMLDPTNGFEVTLKVADPLVISVMKDAGLLAKAKEIMRDEMHRAVFESERTAPALLGSVIADLLQPGESPVYREAEPWA